MNMYYLDAKEENDEEKGKETSAEMLKKMLKTRSVLISGPIDKELADKVIKQLLMLDQESQEEIKVYIDSPGGDSDAGFAIFDMIRFLDSPVRTISIGLTASAGSLILLAAEKGMRCALPNARILIHQPSSGFTGSAADVAIQAREILKLRERLNQLIAEETGQSYEKVAEDTDRDFWMSAEEAKEYGLVDKIIKKKSELETK